MSTTAAELAREKAAKLLRKRGSASSLSSSQIKQHIGRHGSVSTTSYQPEDGQKGPPVKMENTFRVDPSIKFNAAAAKQMAYSILESYLGDEKYEPELCASMSKQLSEVIKGRLKHLPRYKIISVVTIGQLGGQDMRVSSRCLWDQNHDNSATATYTNKTLFAIAYIFAVYYD